MGTNSARYKLRTQGIYWGDYCYNWKSKDGEAIVVINLKSEHVGLWIPQLFIKAKYFKKLKDCKSARIIDYFVVAENVSEIDGEYLNLEDYTTYSFSAETKDGEKINFAFTIHFPEE